LSMSNSLSRRTPLCVASAQPSVTHVTCVGRGSEAHHKDTRHTKGHKETSDNFPSSSSSCPSVPFVTSWWAFLTGLLRYCDRLLHHGQEERVPAQVIGQLRVEGR